MSVTTIVQKEPPLFAYWAEKLADEALELCEKKDYMTLQTKIKEAARERGLAPWTVTNLINYAWDRWGIVRWNRPGLDRFSS